MKSKSTQSAQKLKPTLGFKLIILFIVIFMQVSPALQAQLHRLHYTGSFGPTTTVDGTPLGVETPFVIDCTFDGGFSPVMGLYPISLITIQIGYAFYYPLPAANLNVRFGDSPYLVGLCEGDLTGTGIFTNWFTLIRVI